MAAKERNDNPEPRPEEVPQNLPPGVKLVRTLRGHTGTIGRIAWSPDGKVLASPSADETVRLWHLESGKCRRVIQAHARPVLSVAILPDGRQALSGSTDHILHLWDMESGKCRALEGHTDSVLAVAILADGHRALSGSSDHTLCLWALESGKCQSILRGHTDSVWAVAITPDGRWALSGSVDHTLRLWDLESGECRRVLRGHTGEVGAVAILPDGRRALSGSDDHTLRLWDLESGECRQVLEGHTRAVMSVAITPDGQLIASKGRDDSVRLWRADTGAPIATIPEPASGYWHPSLTFEPRRPLLATVGSDAGTPKEKRDRVIHIWELDLGVLLGRADAVPSAHYINAKVVLVGDTGVGKTGLSLVLNGQPFEATDSTAGRRVWILDSREVELEGNLKQTRETLLWDLAGQPGYRLIHQLHLNEVAVAVVVFDARSETDPLAGVRHWERALRLAQQRQSGSTTPMKKFLVSARTDRGGVSVSKDRIQALLGEFGFDGYFETSAREGWKIAELRDAIEKSIPWNHLPEVASSDLFARIKEFLVEVKKTGRLLAPASDLYDDFARAHPDVAAQEENLRAQFDTCIGRLEARDLIRRMTFGDYVLLQPELLDAYASAMVIAAKEEPDGLGSIAHDAALAGKFFVSADQKVADPGQAQLLLHATVEELVRHDLALREDADDGRYLVFPSQFNRDYEDAPEPKGKAMAVAFDGPVQSLYSTLAVRLGHSGLFTTGRAEMWRNAAVFTATAGGKCGIYLHEFAEAKGRLVIFYDRHEDRQASDETRFHFEEFVLAHAKRRSLEGSAEVVRFFVCPKCGVPVPDEYVKMLRAKETMTFDCPCGGRVSLAEPKERIKFASQVEAMDRSADRRRDFDAFVLSASAETRTPSFKEWAGDDRVTLAIVFTDVVGSTALGREMGDERMNEVRFAHFAQGRGLLARHKGREVKTIGDAIMVAFHCVEAALDFAMEFQKDPGHPTLRDRVRAGIHIGPIDVKESDVFGGTVDFAARVVGAIKEADIALSERAKEDVDLRRAPRHDRLKWERREGVKVKTETFSLWVLKK